MAQTTKWREAEVPSLYSNIMGFTMTPNEISLLFGEIESATPEEITGKPLMKVMLSPEQAHNLATFLGLAVARYVEENGPLRRAANVDEEQMKKALDKQRIVTQ
jgi:hypothetical protein